MVFGVAVAIVATYIFTVNRLLRSDEHWNEAGHVHGPRPMDRRKSSRHLIIAPHSRSETRLKHQLRENLWLDT